MIKKVYFKPKAIQTITEEIKKHGIIETGGVLLGFIENETIFIEKAVDPGPKAIHESIYFRADPDYIEMMIDMEYANSNGKIRYVGEWHTHPEEHPYPSSKDMRSLIEIAEGSESFALLTIIGAIHYRPDTFINNCIVILKERASGNAYELEVEILN